MKQTILLLISILCSSLAFANMESGQLTAMIVGSGSPVYNEERAGPSVLVSNGETRILVDMGNGTQANISKLQIRTSDFSALLFTHHHLDHNEEFVPIFVHSLMGKHNFQIIGTPNTVKLVDSTLELYAEDIAYRLRRVGRTIEERKEAFTVRDIKGGETFKIADISVSTVEVPHTIHTVAYRFDYQGESIVITGDLTYTKKLPELARVADFMIMDSGGMVMKNRQKKRRSPGGGRRAKRVRAHLNLSESSLLAKQSNVKNLVYTHFTRGEVDEEQSLKKIRKNYGGNVIFGKDLMVLRKTNSAKLKSTVSPAAIDDYPVVDTAQETFYDNMKPIDAPAKGGDFYGQDANYVTKKPSYNDNGDGTITDNVTGLIWQKDFEVLSYDKALKYAAQSKLGGHDDWRLPTIKEMYSLILFSGVDASSRDMFTVPDGARPFIDTNYFTFEYGANGERVIDTQYLTTSIYNGLTMRKDKTVFGVNMADGRIKGYPMVHPQTGEDNRFSVKLVRGNPNYGQNQLVDNSDGTVSDLSTGLMWAKDDSQQALNWHEALAWVQKKNEENYLGHNDWKLPDAKELHSIVDYSRSPQATNSAAIDPVFNISTIKTEGGTVGYPFFWSSTTHKNTRGGGNAVYLCFGEALGFMKFPGAAEGKLMDVHGAGAQRSDPKTGNPADYPKGHGPQGDVIRINNYARLVREIK